MRCVLATRKGLSPLANDASAHSAVHKDIFIAFGVAATAAGYGPQFRTDNASRDR
jgi:hypothetical protein